MCNVFIWYNLSIVFGLCLNKFDFLKPFCGPITSLQFWDYYQQIMVCITPSFSYNVSSTIYFTIDCDIIKGLLLKRVYYFRTPLTRNVKNTLDKMCDFSGVNPMKEMLS